MSFAQSMINQMGRDLGRAISKSILEPSKPSKIKSTSKEISSKPTYKKVYISNFDKSLEFQLDHRPSTLVNKLSGLYILLKNESFKHLKDGYLTETEANDFFSMILNINNKIKDVLEILEINEEENKKEIEQIDKLTLKINSLFQTILKESAVGCIEKSKFYLDKYENGFKINFIHYCIFSSIWLRSYYVRNKVDYGQVIIFNVLSVIFFPYGHLIGLVIGLVVYYSEVQDLNNSKYIFKKASDLELKRASHYEFLIKETNSKIEE